MTEQTPEQRAFTRGYLAAVRDLDGGWDYARETAVGRNPEQAAEMAWTNPNWIDSVVAEIETQIETKRLLSRPAARPSPPQGRIYFFADRLRRTVKIGFTSKSISVRQRDLERARGESLDLLLDFVGSSADESALHRRFTADRLPHGEWFTLTALIQDWLIDEGAVIG
jgi:hypothetical protein